MNLDLVLTDLLLQELAKREHIIKIDVSVLDDNCKYAFVNCNGELHRINGPAVEWVHGTKEWFANGKLHRNYGPAVENSDGSKEWWLNGDMVTEQDVMGKS